MPERLGKLPRVRYPPSGVMERAVTAGGASDYPPCNPRVTPPSMRLGLNAITAFLAVACASQKSAPALLASTCTSYCLEYEDTIATLLYQGDPTADFTDVDYLDVVDGEPVVNAEVYEAACGEAPIGERCDSCVEWYHDRFELISRWSVSTDCGIWFLAPEQMEAGEESYYESGCLEECEDAGFSAGTP